MKRKANGKALLPMIVFLVIYLGIGIYYEYINPPEGGMGFYIMSVVVAFMIALVVAFFQNNDLNFDEKIHVCTRGIGDDNITTMLFIFLLAGAFSGIASAAGGASSTANMLLSIIPPQFAIPGLFIIACLISMAMGTSCGTITVLTPIAVGVATTAGLDMAFCVASVVGGSMFGDNLSFISDTTIAATKTQGVPMKAKFQENFKIALPAAIATLALLVVLCLNADNGNIDLTGLDFNVWQALPYFVVLIAAIIGINVFIVLGAGTILFGFVGIGTGTLGLDSTLQSLGSGVNGMFETMIVAILVGALGALMEHHGGFEYILEKVKKYSRGGRGGQFGIGILTSVLDIATANNTIAIVLAGPIAKNISEEFDITPEKTASLMDIFSCVWQGIIPYGAQLLIAAGLAHISSVTIVPYLFYPFFLLIAVVITIIVGEGRGKKNK
ncbi:MAG: Na+/H+ antiporter NhaC family protein [Clostridia bacterium]|nr:Na+/H+ antiporter NhaC family protein [Clostridia bacterium]